MIRFFACFLIALSAGTAHAGVSDYFVKVTSKLDRRAEVVVSFGKERLGPRPISKNSTATYGPVPWPVPETATVTWRFDGGEPQSMTVTLAEHEPKEFKAGDSVVFRLTSAGTVAIFFAVRVGQFRSVEIPLGESKTDARKRELNEQLLASAGLGKLDAVKRLVAEGADPNYLHDSIYASPVRFAANGGHVAVVDFLLNAGAKLTKRDLTVPYLAEKAKALGLDPQ